MLKIRLSRYGRKNAPFYRVVVADARCKRDGAFLANVGTYDPIKGLVSLKEQQILSYLANGAQPTQVVRSLLSKNGI